MVAWCTEYFIGLAHNCIVVCFYEEFFRNAYRYDIRVWCMRCNGMFESVQFIITENSV